jgi:hypothetical protein
MVPLRERPDTAATGARTAAGSLRRAAVRGTPRTGREGAMRYEERDDDELAELAEAGWSPAFAVLVHRHGPALLAAFTDRPDPVESTFEVFVRAMRRLGKRDTSVPVRGWLFALAGREEPTEVPEPVAASLDHLWRDLAERWPDGRRPRRRHPVLRAIAIAVGCVALGVGVPTVVLGLPDAAEEPPVSVRAEPLEDAPPDEPEPVDLPDFEFPDVAEGPQPNRQEPDAPAPLEPVAPAPAPAPGGGGGGGGGRAIGGTPTPWR